MIILSHHTGESYGLLGPQLVASFISSQLGIPTFVVGLLRKFDRRELFRFLEEHYKNQKKIIGFSHLCGRPDLLELMGELKTSGFRTVLGGPQAISDFLGEEGAEKSPWRFKGLKDRVDFGYGGPVDGLSRDLLESHQGLFSHPWDKGLYLEVDWDNLFIFDDHLEKLRIETFQVLRGIGCPYASVKKTISLDPPSFLKEGPKLEVQVKGCSFCDVAWEKGFCGFLDDEKVIRQIENLPERHKRKMPFELIDEYPLAFLPKLLELVNERGLFLEQINLVLRPDDILRHRENLEKSLKELKRQDTRLLLASIGFESFSSKILSNLNKGITPEMNLEVVKILRDLKKRFPNTFLYRRDEGAVHGLIHPTPWDDPDTEAETWKRVGVYQLFEDILPPHSTPLIIHHGSPLGEWIRRLEEKGFGPFKRHWTIIQWWQSQGA
jgi:radical SAM superfamily enzyme YgiQ (UPF0313 family)